MTFTFLIMKGRMKFRKIERKLDILRYIVKSFEIVIFWYFPITQKALPLPVLLFLSSTTLFQKWTAQDFFSNVSLFVTQEPQ